jgi:prohibitin 1
VQKRQEEARATIIRAEGDGEASQLVAQANAKYGGALLMMRKIEAASEIAGYLAKSPNVTFLGGNTINMINIPAGGAGL